MSEDQAVETPKPTDRTAGITAALIGLCAAVISGVLPWLLSRIEHAPATGSAVAAVASPAAPTSYPWPDLTLGTWQICDATDEEGTEFNGSTLQFRSQVATPHGLQLEGFFEWWGDGILLGQEHFRANLDAATRLITIQGSFVVDERNPPRLAVGSFTARLSPNGRELLEGTWGSTPGHMPGVAGGWSARR